MKTLLTSMCISIGLAGAAFAQTPEGQTQGGLCHHAGLTYSPGSMITMGQSLQQCAVVEGVTSVWTPVSSEDPAQASANCVSGGREFGQGSVLNAGVADLVCRNGIWFQN